MKCTYNLGKNIWNIVRKSNKIGHYTLHKTIKLESLMQLAFFLFLLKIGEKLLNYKLCQKMKIWRRLGQFIAKNLFVQTISDKRFETK